MNHFSNLLQVGLFKRSILYGPQGGPLCLKDSITITDIGKTPKTNYQDIA